MRCVRPARIVVADEEHAAASPSFTTRASPALHRCRQVTGCTCTVSRTCSYSPMPAARPATGRGARLAPRRAAPGNLSRTRARSCSRRSRARSRGRADLVCRQLPEPRERERLERRPGDRLAPDSRRQARRPPHTRPRHRSRQPTAPLTAANQHVLPNRCESSVTTPLTISPVRGSTMLLPWGQPRVVRCTESITLQRCPWDRRPAAARAPGTHRRTLPPRTPLSPGRTLDQGLADVLGRAAVHVNTIGVTAAESVRRGPSSAAGAA